MRALVSLTCLGLVATVTAIAAAPARAERLKELVDVEGVRENPLVGYGLVVGLQGTGDDASSPATRQALAQLIKHLGVTIDPAQIKAKNVAAVVVTAQLPPFARAGSTIDVTVSSVGTAKSLQGGTLVATPLKGADKRTYALAQGSLSLGGFAVEGASGSAQKKNHATVARVPGGGVIEQGAPGALADDEVVLLLHDPDFTTASRIAEAVDGALGPGSAVVRDPGAVVVRVGKAWRGKVVGLVATLERLEVVPDAPAKVVIDERTGTIVVGAGVTLGPAAIAYGSLTVTVSERQTVSQPGVLSNGDTVTTPESGVAVEEGGGGLVVENGAATVGELAAVLNALGLKPRDLVAIFQALAAAGALRAEIEVL
jgi:flagellar P-ring protein precursor FlgI